MDTIKNLVNEISEKDQNKIEEYIKGYALDENDCFPIREHHFAGVEKVLQPWSKAKQNLYKLLGNKLMISKRVSFEKPEEEIRGSICQALDDHSSNFSRFLGSFEDYFRIKYRSFLKENSNSELDLNQLLRALSAITSIDALVSNKVPEGFAQVWESPTIITRISMPTPSGRTIDISVGAKVMKILGKISNEFDIPGFEEFRIEHSRIMNDKKMAGNITLSIHPLDYMTMSDNDCSWESCMSWKNFGCYRQGTVEMMNSSYVIVGYMNSDKPMYLFDDNEDEFTWSNKRLRCLFIVSDKFIAKVKSYPYQHEEFEKTIINWIAELSKENLGIGYDSEFFKIKSNYPDNIIYKGTKIQLSFMTHNMYNDFGTTESYLRFNDNILDIDTSTLCFCYSGVPECMWCGDTNIDYTNTDMLVCDRCAVRNYCSECGTRVYDNDYYLDEDGNCYCEYCFDNYCEKNLLTGDYKARDALSKIFIVKSSEQIIKANEEISSWNAAPILDITIKRTLESSKCNSFFVSHIEDINNINEKLKNELSELFNVDELKEIEYEEWGCKSSVFVIPYDECSEELKEYYQRSFISDIDSWATSFDDILKIKERDANRHRPNGVDAFRQYVNYQVVNLDSSLPF